MHKVKKKQTKQMTRSEWCVQGTKPLMYTHFNNQNQLFHGKRLKVIKSRFAKYGVRHVNSSKETFELQRKMSGVFFETHCMSRNKR